MNLLLPSVSPQYCTPESRGHLPSGQYAVSRMDGCTAIQDIFDGDLI